METVKGKTRKQIYLVPYVHLDTQWRWEYPTTIKKYIKKTIDDNIRLLEKYPEYCINFTGALRYRMMKEYYPEGYEKVKKYIEEGRWFLGGPCLDENDALIPSVESAIRNILYGYCFETKEFGKSSSAYMLPDCFGFPLNYPTILKHCDISGFSTQKLSWKSARGIPFDLGIWEGKDNSKLLSAFNPGNYVSKLPKRVQEDKCRVKKLDSFGDKYGIYRLYQYYGVGDVGGAPDELSVQNAIKSKKLFEENISDIEVVQGSNEGFFNSLTEEEINKLDTINGDLLLINHSAGSLTSKAIMKRWNRTNENLASAAEYLALVCEHTAGIPYPIERINKTWQRVLGSQMHDILPGTCTPNAYRFSYNDEVLALKEFNKIIDDSIEGITPYIKGDGEIVIANTFESEKTCVVEFEAEARDGNGYALQDDEGNHLSVQKSTKDGEAFLLASVCLKAFEIKRYKLVEYENANSELSLRKDTKDFILENSNLRVRISHCGEVYSIYDKRQKAELLKAPLSYQLQHERPTMFPAWNMDWKDRKRPPYMILSKGNAEIVEDGNVRKTVRITTYFNKSVFIKDISLSVNSEKVDFTEKIKWREKGVSLKLAVVANIEEPRFEYNWETSVIERSINNKTQFEVPSRYYVDVKNDTTGLAIFENCKYGYDRPDENTLRMTLLFTPHGYLSAGFLDQRTLDFGNHTICYALYPHAASDCVDSGAKAFNRPLKIYKIHAQNQTPKNIRILSIDNDNIGLLALKKAENEKGIILRLYCRKKENTSATVTVYRDVKRVCVVNGLEQIREEIPHNNNTFSIDINGNGISSYYIECENRAAVDTVFNEAALKYGQNKLDVFYPAEQMPKEITSGNISFKVHGNGAVLGNGQIIPLDAKCNRISFLVSANDNTAGSYSLLDVNKNILRTGNFRVIKRDGYVGEYDTRLWKYSYTDRMAYDKNSQWFNFYKGIKDGHIEEGKIAHYTTHSINDGEILPYCYGYMGQVDIDYENDCKYIELDSRNAIGVFGATISKQHCRAKNIAHKTDVFDM